MDSHEPLSPEFKTLVDQDPELMKYLLDNDFPQQIYSVTLSKAELEDEDEYYLPIEAEEREQYLKQREQRRATRKVNVVIISIPPEKLAQNRHLISSLLCCYDHEDIGVELQQRLLNAQGLLQSRLSALLVSASPIISLQERGPVLEGIRCNMEDFQCM